MLIDYCSEPDLCDVLLRLLVNLTNPAMLLFRDELPRDGAGRRTYLDIVEISHTYKSAFALSPALWATLGARLQKILNTVSGMKAFCEDVYKVMQITGCRRSYGRAKSRA